MKNLTGQESRVLIIILTSEKALTATEILEIDTDLNSNTTKSILRSLLKKALIEVSEIKYSGTVLCRSYKATQHAKNIAVRDFINSYKNLKKIAPVPQLFSTFVETNNDPSMDDAIRELELLISHRKEEEIKEVPE